MNEVMDGLIAPTENCQPFGIIAGGSAIHTGECELESDESIDMRATSPLTAQTQEILSGKEPPKQTGNTSTTA
jgi:hypothetical protein